MNSGKFGLVAAVFAVSVSVVFASGCAHSRDLFLCGRVVNKVYLSIEMNPVEQYQEESSVVKKALARELKKRGYQAINKPPEKNEPFYQLDVQWWGPVPTCSLELYLNASSGVKRVLAVKVYGEPISAANLMVPAGLFQETCFVPLDNISYSLTRSKVDELMGGNHLVEWELDLDVAIELARTGIAYLF